MLQRAAATSWACSPVIQALEAGCERGERASERERKSEGHFLLLVLPIIQHDNLDTSNEEHGCRVAAEAGSLS